MERNSTQIGIIVISAALALTIGATVVRMVDDTSGRAHAAPPVLSGESAPVVTNKSGKGDRVELDVAIRPLDTRCVSHARTTVCTADAPTERLARLD